MINARIAQIDHLRLHPVERDHAPPVVPEAGRLLARLEVPDGPERDRHDAQDPGPELHQERTAAGHRSGRRNSTRARCSRRSTKKSTACSADAPFGALVGDYEFGKHPEDMELLEQISHVAAAAHAPFCQRRRSRPVQPAELHQPGRPARPGQDFRHHRIRQVEDRSGRARIPATWRCALPRTLGRLPYGKDTKPVEEFSYEEHVDGTDHSKYLWMNAAYALATRMTNSFSQLRHVRGHARRGRRRPGGRPSRPQLLHRRRRRRDEVPDRGAHHRPSREGTRRPGLRSAGALQGHRLRRVLQRAVAARSPSCTTRTRPMPMRGSRRRLPYIMAVSRFAHYLKAMMRDKIGSFMSRDEAEIFLNRWITQLRDSGRYGVAGK